MHKVDFYFGFMYMCGVCVCVYVWTHFVLEVSSYGKISIYYVYFTARKELFKFMCGWHMVHSLRKATLL